MDKTKKSFLIGTLLGLVIGAVFTFTVLCIVGTIIVTEGTSTHFPVDKMPDGSGNGDSKCFEHPISYEGKKKVSVQVIQVFDDSALAKEGTLDYNGEIEYITGKVVMIVGNNHYTDEIVNINDPQQIGLYTYLNGYDRQVTVPVIQAESDIINK